MRGTITTIKTEPITAEKINENRDDWNLTLSRKIAELCANGKQVYLMPNGVYAIQKSTKLDRNCARLNEIMELVETSNNTTKRIQELNALMET